jgi:hypothetical protein
MLACRSTKNQEVEKYLKKKCQQKDETQNYIHWVSHGGDFAPKVWYDLESFKVQWGSLSQELV